jgi:hypothetical protein
VYLEQPEHGKTSEQASRSTTDGVEVVKTLKTLMVNHALPLWWREGWDASRGGFVERLDRQGNADYAAPRRIRVQARQIYCFAKAAQLGWYPEGREIAMKGLGWRRPKAPTAGLDSFSDRSDRIHRQCAADAYDHAFILLALATVYQLTRDAPVRDEIESLPAFLHNHLRSPHGGFIEGIPPMLPRRRNPHMHLFETMMIATFDATGDPVHQNRAGDLFRLFVPNLFDYQRQVVGEYFEEDWSRLEPASVEPAVRQNGFGFSKALNGSPVARLVGIARSWLPRHCAIATTCSTRMEISESPLGAYGPRRRLLRPGSRKSRRENRRRSMKRSKPLPGFIGIISVIRCLAAGTISSTAATDRWLIRFRPLPFTTFSALSRKRSAFSAGCDRYDLTLVWNGSLPVAFTAIVTHRTRSEQSRITPFKSDHACF